MFSPQTQTQTQTQKPATARITGILFFPTFLLWLSSILGSTEAFTGTTTLPRHSSLATNHRDQLKHLEYGTLGSNGNSNSNSNSNGNVNVNGNGNSSPRLSFRLSAERNPQRTDAATLKAEAEALRAKAEKLRSEIEQSTRSDSSIVSGGNTETEDAVATTAVAGTRTAPSSTPASPWTVTETMPTEEGDRDYRLYVDIGREEGTWMDPRWGASGNRIEFALDVRLSRSRLAEPEMADKMVRDNATGKSSPVFALESAPFARLRDGFDRMGCGGGAYRIDAGKNGRNTLRLYVRVEGTTRADQGYIYGDVSVPSGCLYFSLPCFGNGIDNLSIKEGVVSVRQIGWHTGWRREESRICGVFTAKSLVDARKRDPY